MIILIAKFLADCFQLLAQEKLTLLIIHVLLDSLLDIIAHLNGFQALGKFFHHPVQHFLEFDDFKNYLLFIQGQVQLGSDQIGYVKGIRNGRYSHIQFWWQLGKRDQFFELVAQIKDIGFDLLVLLHLHFKNFDPGFKVWFLRSIFQNSDFFCRTHNHLVEAFRGFDKLMDIADDPNGIKMLGKLF